MDFMNHPFSLLMSTYQGDDPAHLQAALKSVCASTVQPAELIMVLDGPVKASVEHVISSYQQVLPIRLLPLENNQGLGRALAQGLAICKHELVARFDTDDLCMPERFEKQLNFMLHHPAIDACSSPVLEFQGTPETSALCLKTVPSGPEAVAHYARRRNPLNHMAVMFRKTPVLQAGNYQDERYFEDYALWARMLVRGAQLDNLSEPTVWVRAGNDMIARRGGWAYARHEWRVQKKFRESGFISTPELLRNLLIRMPVRLLPASLRSWIYANKLR